MDHVILDFLASEINRTIAGINGSSIDYMIKDHFTAANMTKQITVIVQSKDIIEAKSR